MRRFEDLIAWQLAYQLQQEVFAFSSNNPAVRDSRLCDQIRECTRSAASNIAEGFGRFAPREFARFLRIAVGSLHESKNHLRDALDRGYLSPSEHERLERLALRAIKANVRLQAYLRHCDPPTS